MRARVSPRKKKNDGPKKRVGSEGKMRLDVAGRSSPQGKSLEGCGAQQEIKDVLGGRGRRCFKEIDAKSTGTARRNRRIEGFFEAAKQY